MFHTFHHTLAYTMAVLVMFLTLTTLGSLPAISLIKAKKGLQCNAQHLEVIVLNVTLLGGCLKDSDDVLQMRR